LSPSEPTRRHLLAAAGGIWFAPMPALASSDQLNIGGIRGTIDFAIGESKVFRTTGSFKDWQGKIKVDDLDVPRSTVDVVVKTTSVKMIDDDQTAMLKDSDFFDVEKFPEMSFHSTEVERTGEETLKVTGDLTLRGIKKPMVLDVSVTDRKPGAAPGTRYARIRGKGTLKRSEFGMTKFIDVVGDTVEISIRADAWR
jgi:polyisoprenoid-binding protein YceI